MNKRLLNLSWKGIIEKVIGGIIVYSLTRLPFKAFGQYLIEVNSFGIRNIYVLIASILLIAFITMIVVTFIMVMRINKKLSS